MTAPVTVGCAINAPGGPYPNFDAGTPEAFFGGKVLYIHMIHDDAKRRHLC